MRSNNWGEVNISIGIRSPGGLKHSGKPKISWRCYFDECTYLRVMTSWQWMNYLCTKPQWVIEGRVLSRSCKNNRNCCRDKLLLRLLFLQLLKCTLWKKHICYSSVFFSWMRPRFYYTTFIFSKEWFEPTKVPKIA